MDNDVATIGFLTVNDVYELVPNSHGWGGMAELMTLIQQQRQDANHPLLLTMNGDFLSASQVAIHFQGYTSLNFLKCRIINILYLVNI